MDPGPEWLGIASSALLDKCWKLSGWQATASIHAMCLLRYKVRGEGGGERGRGRMSDERGGRGERKREDERWEVRRESEI